VSLSTWQASTKAGRRRWGWDVEASDPLRPWDGATLAVVKSEEGDCERFVGPDCLERVAAHMQKARGTYFAHYGGGYDVPLLLNHWRPKRLVLSGSNILIAEDAHDLKLRDTFPWWLSSLAKVGQAVGVHKLDVDRAQMERLSLDEQVKYCEQDVDVLLAGVGAASDFLTARGAQQAFTAGQSAASLVRALEPGSWKALQRNRCDVDDVMTMLNSGAVRGGRVECGARGVVEGVHVYDIKSSYPARYAHRDVGVGLRVATPDDTVGVWRCRWRWTDRRRVPPALDARTMCGVGDCEAWLIDDEIAAFESCGVAVERLEGWAAKEVIPIGQSFAAEMFACKEGAGPERFCAKVFLNSWHGKATMSPLQEQFTAWYPKSYWGPGGPPQLVPEGPNATWNRYLTLDADREGLLKPYQQPITGTLILGRARVAIWEIDDALHKAGWPVLYNDTDSVMTTCPPELMPWKLGNQLGELAHEGGPYVGYFLGPKAYCLTDPTTGQVKKCALKGIPHRSYTDGVVDPDGLFREARGVERVRGNGVFARKGPGRDTRVQLFERALGPHGAARALKDGLSTFLRGVQGVGDRGPGVWCRSPVIRTVRPSGRGKVHVSETEYEYLATVEVGCARLLQSLPDPEARVLERHAIAAVELARAKGLVEVVHDKAQLPRLPREQYDRPSGKRGTRVDAWQSYRELLEASRVTDDEATRRDGAAFASFAARSKGATTWRDLARRIEAFNAEGFHAPLHAPIAWLTPSRRLMRATDAGVAWLAALGPLWNPDDEEEDR
jgi:hypothetical protein